LENGLKNKTMHPDSNSYPAFPDKNNGTSQLISLYEHVLIGIVALLPLFAAAYIYLFQNPTFVVVSHGLHEVSIGVAILQSSFVGYVTWRCYVSSGEPFMRWLTLSFMGFALIYALHGLFTVLSDCHMELFLVYGPTSRLVMAGLLLTGLITFDRASHPPAQRTRAKFWLTWILDFLVLDAFIGWLTLSKIIPFQTLRMFMEVSPILLILAGMVVSARLAVMDDDGAHNLTRLFGTEFTGVYCSETMESSMVAGASYIRRRIHRFKLRRDQSFSHYARVIAGIPAGGGHGTVG
jgi:hypothetical protein